MTVLAFRSPVVRRGEFVLAPGEVTIAAGRVTVLLGPNGGGKSTAIRAAAGLLVPEQGLIALEGEPVHRIPAPRRAARASLVVQRPEAGAPFSVREMVALGRAFLPEEPGRVERAIAQVGLADHADRPFHVLSGGQQQRVAFARALAQHSPGGVLLLDEPFAAVDPPETGALVSLVRFAAAAGATVLVATHDLAIASALADDAWFLAGGRTHAFGAAASLLAPSSVGGFLGIRVLEAAGDAGGVAVPDYRATIPTR